MGNSDLIITDSAIDLAIERLGNMEDENLNEVFEKLSHQQPSLMGFVVGLGEGLENDEAEEDLLYLITIVWHAIELARNADLKTVSEGEMNALGEKIDERLDFVLSIEDADEEEVINSMIGNSPQPALTSYLVDEFFSDEYLNIPEQSVAKMFACITVLAEALGES